jgi:hypothetical protein
MSWHVAAARVEVPRESQYGGLQVEIITVANAQRFYPDEWVRIEITRDNRDHQRIQGRLVGYSPERTVLEEPYRRFRAEHLNTQVYEFYTGALVADGVIAIL